MKNHTPIRNFNIKTSGEDFMRKSLLFLLTLSFVSVSSIYAATQGNIAINATVPNIAAVAASDAGAVALTDLGNTAYANSKIGHVVLNSNGVDGFTLTYSSTASGFLVKDGNAAAPADEKVAYTVTLSNGSGTLGTNVTETNLTDRDSNGGAASFTAASNASPTHGRQYDVGISTASKGLVQGSYSDTLQITIANI
ncbi:MAG: hypothetical protein ACI9BD_000055 [Candidatus Marinamargulisbacteria bacterium]|jgi:hypothetical protein